MATSLGNRPAPEISQALLRLRETLAGTMIEPGDYSYDDARAVWNGMIDVRPRVIVRAGSTADIDSVLQVAQDIGLPLAVRAGGHNVAGHGTAAEAWFLTSGS
jgi:FAD/FMN-containing dehydrogenase